MEHLAAGTFQRKLLSPLTLALINLSSRILHVKEAWKKSDRLSSLVLCPQTLRNRMKLCSEVTSNGSSTTWTWELWYLLATQGWSFQQRFGANSASCTFSSCKPYIWGCPQDSSHIMKRKKKSFLDS